MKKNFFALILLSALAINAYGAVKADESSVDQNTTNKVIAPADNTATKKATDKNSVQPALPATPAPAASAPTKQPASTTASESFQLTNDKDRLSYTIGVDMGQNFKQQNIEVNPAALFQGLKDVLNNDQLLLTKPEMEQTLQSFQKQLSLHREAALKELAQKNQQAGNQFLTENKAKKDIITLPSGLQYKIVTPGNGPKPTQNDVVTVEYTGKLLNGNVFDSTEKSGKPVTFKVSDVIPGWIEALQLMNMGATWEVFIPGNLGYGEQGIPGLIGPNETLIFNIHLLAVKKAEQQNKTNSRPKENNSTMNVDTTKTTPENESTKEVNTN